MSVMTLHARRRRPAYRLAAAIIGLAAATTVPAACGGDAGPAATGGAGARSEQTGTGSKPSGDRAQMEAWYRNRSVPPGPATFEPAGAGKRMIPTGHGAIAAFEWPGAEPAVVMAHGFPDDHHLYDRVVPLLAGRHVITFDWLGWGESDTPADYTYNAANQTGELDAVVSGFGLDKIALVVHDASGPPGIDWAMEHPDRIERLVVLNTYYLPTPTLRPPEAIWLFSTPATSALADAAMADPEAGRSLYYWQVGSFIVDDHLRSVLLPEYWSRFQRAIPAFRRLNDALLDDVASRAVNEPKLRAFPRRVELVWGTRDPYLNTAVGRALAERFPHATFTAVDDAHHYLQVDRPDAVAARISAP
jgi:pimeloyl-ACP methyl ester carboxylesterase